MVCCSCFSTEIALGIALICVASYWFVNKKFNYWKRLHIPHRPPAFPLGNCQGLSRTRSLADILHNLYIEGKGSGLYGVYILLGPNLLIRDPELVKTIIVKDFGHFNGRGFKIDKEMDPLSGHLFFLDGTAWRNLRAKLTPTFTSGKMRMMFPIVNDCCKEMGQFLTSQNGKVHEVGELITKYATNVITRCAFGLDVDFFQNPDPMLLKMIQRVSSPTFLDAIKRGLTFSVSQVFPSIKFPLVPKDLSKYFITLIENAMEEREKNKIHRNDFLQLLIELKNKGFVDDVDIPRGQDQIKGDFKFGVKEAAAQAFVFLLGGFDTSSTTLQCCLYELSLHPEIQEKVRQEVQTVLNQNSGELTYDSLQEMHYLEQVLKETLRLHPVVRFLGRECTKPFQMPKMELILEPGMKVWISTSGLQMDPQYFPQPEKFNPDRFAPANRDNIIPYTYLPFGEGPRVCIGNRFAMMQMKAVVASLLSQFEVEASEETPAPPLKVDPKKTITLIVGGVPLKITKITCET